MNKTEIKSGFLQNENAKNNLTIKFFFLVFIISVPFWLAGAISGSLEKYIPINLPISSLCAFCPMIAALIFAYKEDKKSGMNNLLKRVFDYQKIKNNLWYIPLIFLMPVIMIFSYVVMLLIGSQLPDTKIPFQMIPVFFILFFIGAIGEELGWSGYLTDRIQNRYSALKASIILGLIWAIWHIIPFIQTHNSPIWILCQCFNAVSLRILIIWLYNNTGKSVFTAILFHTMINVSNFLFPNYGSHYDPFITGIILIIVVIIIVFLWGQKTLAKYRYQ